MVLSELGAFSLWLLLVAWFILQGANKRSRESLRDIVISSWELCRVLWDDVSYRKEAEAVGPFFGKVLSCLLRSGFDDASASVSVKYSKRRIEFRKYFRGLDYGIGLRFPNDNWASAYFQEMQTYCDARDIPYRIEADGTGDSRELLWVDFGRDVDKAANFTQGIWTEVFGLPEEAPRRFNYHGISPYGEPVERADQEMMTFEEGWRYLHPDRDFPSLRGGCAAAIWVLCLWFVFFGLFISALMSRGETAEWSLRFAEVPIGGSTESLVFLCLYLFNITVGQLVSKKLLRPRIAPDPPWLDGVYRWFRWVLRITLPIAVVLVWTGP